MRLEKQFDVRRTPDAAARIASREATLLGLFAGSETEIVARDGSRRTTRTHYTALGREGVATFHFDFQPDGTVEFSKVCDGNVWKELSGKVTFQKRGNGARVKLQMNGKTKTLVPELAIRAPMREQMEQMAAALRECIDAADDSEQ